MCILRRETPAQRAAASGSRRRKGWHRQVGDHQLTAEIGGREARGATRSARTHLRVIWKMERVRPIRVFPEENLPRAALSLAYVLSHTVFGSCLEAIKKDLSGTYISA